MMRKLAVIVVAVLLAGTIPSLLGAQRPSAGSASAAYPQREGYVDAHGVLIYYTTVGQGAPLIILHGGPGASHDYFLPYLLALARSNQLIFIDERGSGRSQRLEDASQYTVEAMVEDVEDVRVALRLGKISLLGHSYGGVLAQAYALKYQQHLSHLILNSTWPSTVQMNEVLARMKSKLPAPQFARLNALEQAGLFGKGEAWEHGRYPAEYSALAWGYGYFSFMYGARPDANYDPSMNSPSNWVLYRAMWGEKGEFVIDGNLKSVEYVERLPSIHVPTLFLAGDHDECDPSLSIEMHEKIVDSKLVILPDSGHMNFVDQPKLWEKSVQEFLTKK